MGPVTIISSYRAGPDTPQQMPGLMTEDTESPHYTGGRRRPRAAQSNGTIMQATHTIYSFRAATLKKLKIDEINLNS